MNELRFFCLYVSKLNPLDEKSRIVKIDIENFEEIFRTKINTTLFKRSVDKFMSRLIEIREEDGWCKVTLYSKFKCFDDGGKYIEISCNNDLLPYLFDLKEQYTVYNIENISKLNSVAKIRLYEILKQYEKIGIS